MIGLMLIYLLSIKKAKSPNYATTDQLVLRVYSVQNNGTIYKGLYNSAFFHNNLFSKNQFRFLKGRSTMLQLLHIMEE